MATSRRLVASAAAVAAAVLTVLVAVTVSGAAPETAPATTPEAAAPGQAPGLVLPFDAYGYSEHDIHTIESAEDVLIEDCMRTQGFTWTPLPRPSSSAAARDAASPHRLRYGLTDADDAARLGYHPPPPTPAQQRREAVWQARDALPRPERLAAFGDSGTGGCWGRAHDRLLRDVPPGDPALLAGHTREAFDTARRAPEVTTALADWRACMARAGHDYADPLQAFGDDAWDTARPAAGEVAVAEADVRCKGETGLVATWAAAEERVQREAVRAHPADFQALADRKESWLLAARETLDDR